MIESVERVKPGINPNVCLDIFTISEKNIIKRLSKEWYVTNGGGELNLGANSTYRYFLIKPTDLYQDTFNLEREIIVVFSPYPSFEPRTLDAIESASRNYQSLRLEKVCSVIISKDSSVEQKIREILKNDRESQVVVPFTYDELLNTKDDFFVRNRFKNNFYSRDLFAFEGPLKSDLYFFGRTDLIHTIANRHKSNENSALFGLRKTGKTSVIFGAQRALARMGAKSVFIDCQNPAFHQRRWNTALFYIIGEMKSQLKLDIGLKTEDKYTETDAPLIFEKELLRIYNELKNQNVLIIFDEIENITFEISPSKHWADDNDFIFFWQTLRSLYQKLHNVFSYLIVGTNATCVECPTIHGKDNPIFNQVPFSYINGFDVPQTREMIRKLGRLMGLKFDEVIYGKLTDDFGGHPFLIRHVCSVIHQISATERPVFVDKALYEIGKKKFNDDYANYIEMILTVLKSFYNDEFEMLKYLSINDMKTFNEFASMSPYYTNHLVGYGIINKNNGNYSFKIESIKEYLAKMNRYKKIHMTNEEMLNEISDRRNKLEPKLRILARNQLRATYGKAKAFQLVLDLFGEPRKSKYAAKSYEELFDANVCSIYLDDIRKIINKYWDCYTNIFPDKIEVDANLTIINKSRADAHAKTITQEGMEIFRSAISKIEAQVGEYLS